MALPKKRRSNSKQKIRKNIWKAQASSAALKSISFGKSLLLSDFFCMLFSTSNLPFSRFSDPLKMVTKTVGKPIGFGFNIKHTKEVSTWN
uniref:Ribosomal protein L32 n=1 Tax=Erodium gruinum TaxID=337380 RepID=A0A0A0PFV7_9ROSI|nr:ribosomal protein L32 [Erodium gruinum]YP_009111619.1 ribosomal protein L32 [Erodium gruinum]AHH80591.1 ribosomal protein L32 [Erodium gruinum]AHH80630.1 ribosomal protein L32 [Erodium gruinum]